MTPPNDDLDFGQTIRGFVEGQKVFDRYVLKGILGRGGMGIVWLAWDEKLERDIALKFMPDLVRLDAAAVDELKRETRKSLSLTHPNIVRIHDYVDDAQSAAISMEYIEGATLSALRVEKPERVFEVEELREWISQVCTALAYAHEEVRVVHRDLKPANLMVTSAGKIKVTDFGIARSICDSASRMSMAAGSSSGTLVYMSPQQLDGEDPSATDDVYSLGATLYELLTSRPPFTSGSIYTQVKEKVPPSMSERRAALEISGQPIPPVWEAAVAACLAKDPADRPQGAQQLLDMLEGRGEIPAPVTEEVPPPIPETPAVVEPQPEKPRKSQRLVIAGVLLGILLLCIAAMGTWWFGYEGPRRERSQPIYRGMDQAEIERLADNGDAATQFVRGYQLVNGDSSRGVKIDVEAARQWLEKATAQGHPLAAMELTNLEEDGPRLTPEYVRQITDLAEGGNAIAQFYAGKIADYGSEAEADAGEAVKWYRLAADQGLATAQFELGVKYHDADGVARDVDKAINWWRLASDQGYAKAQHCLGMMYGDGYGVAKDEKEAIRLYRLAASQGEVDAEVRLGWIYSSGQEVAKDESEVIKWWSLAADQGNAEARKSLGDIYNSRGDIYNYGRGVEEDDSEAVRWYRLAAEQGNAEAQNHLGHMYFVGEGVEEDMGESVRWYRLAAEQGDAEAQNALGDAYSDGFGVEEDESESLKWYRLAADQGYADAQSNLGFIYANGYGVAKDKSEAIKWYRLAADQGGGHAEDKLKELEGEQKDVDEKNAARLTYRKMDQAKIERLAEEGDPEAQFVLGYRLVYADPSRGVPADVEAAKPWLEKAAAQGHPLAAIELATILNSSSETADNKDRAAKLAREHLQATLALAKGGDPIAQLYVGFLYGRGIGVDKDYSEAVKWCRLAAGQGNVIAQTDLGDKYRRGRGVEEDESKATNLYRLAADQGHARAQNQLGFAYCEGLGVTQDRREAVKWFRLAAEQGDASGQNNLGAMYADGKGVAKDRGEAIKWFRLAAAQGHENAKKELKKLGVE